MGKRQKQKQRWICLPYSSPTDPVFGLIDFVLGFFAWGHPVPLLPQKVGLQAYESLAFGILVIAERTIFQAKTTNKNKQMLRQTNSKNEASDTNKKTFKCK